MCYITRSAIVPRGCKKPQTKHVIMMAGAVPCYERTIEAQKAYGLIEGSAAANVQVEVSLCPLRECTVIDSFSSRTVVVKLQAAIENSCPICLGKMTQVQALTGCGTLEDLSAQYAALPGGAILKEAGLPDLDQTHVPFQETRKEFSFYPHYYKKAFKPAGLWHVWNRESMIQHEQKERPVTTQERLGLQFMLNQIQKFKGRSDGKLKAWNQEFLPDKPIPGVAFFQEDAAGNFHLRSQLRSRKSM